MRKQLILVLFFCSCISVVGHAQITDRELEAREAADAANFAKLQACTGDGTRVALVVGNQQYQIEDIKIRAAASDADKMTELLCAQKFTVFKKLDLVSEDQSDLMDEFNKIPNGMETAIIYYAGHGMLFENNIYLVPVDFKNS